ncbi:uncharacterized protein [Cicer arietinum]|uniref:Uncharacterized protein LOC105853032 isoform X2 n=1 Tax=Cicer arietinum TaxID=3827 RepID=A0A1S3EI16_CICAR|nr:uncharacterized protein LOC105853032 isoform X2 [Cicer arietinum]
MMKIKAFNLCFLCALFLLSVVATETSKDGYAKESKKNVLVDKLDGGRKPIDIESFYQNKPVGAGNKTREERMMEKEAKQKEKEAKQKENEEKQKEKEAKIRAGARARAKAYAKAKAKGKAKVKGMFRKNPTKKGRRIREKPNEEK